MKMDEKRMKICKLNLEEMSQIKKMMPWARHLRFSGFDEDYNSITSEAYLLEAEG